jgi:hypothetical protein
MSDTIPHTSQSIPKNPYEGVFNSLSIKNVFEQTGTNWIQMEVEESGKTRMLAFKKPDLTKTSAENAGIILDQINTSMSKSTPSFYKCFYIDKKGQKRPTNLLNSAATNRLISKYEGIKVPYALRQKDCITTIEKILGKTLQKNFRVGKYKLDGYCAETNTAYEIDEPEHKYRQKEDQIREEEIRKKLNCKFVRIKLP